MARVSVLLPVFNGVGVVHDAIRSVLNQTFSDLELVIVDDGSTDATSELISRIPDGRLKIVRHGQNRGIVDALNSGLSAASGDLIARLDADDIARPDRIQKQVSYLEAHPRVGLLATGWT